MNSTPISDAAVLNSEPHGYEVVPYCVAQTLERDNAALHAEVSRLNHQHANDEAANQMLSDACSNLRKRTILECAALFSGGMRNREIYVNDAEEIILALLEK
jgi:hypothetical protein